ncbi:hypothetical protein [Paragemmobacter straminiformis]|uniref:DUF1127 domain-containing protein n=1 Tax=Paragemmobacter straminiformis TaxID=2045119 RepID=A0A842I801_9RHOB|nr:hypothetical protein [Gemmobacter straminiformis]MBC2835523.1 hypothetical protein [Gemmobacter straminiformis]
MINTVKTPLHLVIDEHGAARVFWASLLALLTARRSAAEELELLSDHMRRDIGLPPRGSPLPEAPMRPVRW